MADVPHVRLPMATIMVFAKGFRVSESTEEFQLVIPEQTSSAERGLEQQVCSRIEWPKILSKCYGLSDAEARRQLAVLFEAQETSVMAVARTEDRHGRPSIVVVAATAPVDWSGESVTTVIGRCHSLADRMAQSYSSSFRETPSQLTKQLRLGRFLPDRSFALETERASSVQPWGAIVTAVREWRGIRGVATPRLVDVGSNVLLATEHEAMMASGHGTRIAGYFDRRKEEIVAIGEGLERWLPQLQHSDESSVGQASAVEPEASVGDLLKSIDQSAKCIEHALGSVSSSIGELRDQQGKLLRVLEEVALELRFGNEKERRKRRR